MYVWTTSTQVQTQTQEMKKIHVLALAFAFHACKPRQRKSKCKCKDTKQTTSWRSIGSRPPRGSEVEKKMAASISDEMGLHLRRMCEPGFKVGLKEMCYTSPLFPRLTIHLVSPSDIPSWILTRILLPVWTTLSCRSLIAWPLPTKDHTSPLEEYCRLVMAHTSAPRRRYKVRIKKYSMPAALFPAFDCYGCLQKCLAAPYHPPENWIWNPRTKNSESSTWNLEPTSWNPKSSTVLEYLAWGKLHVNNTGDQDPSNLTLRSGRSILHLAGNVGESAPAPTKTCGRHFDVYSHQLLGQANFFEVFQERRNHYKVYPHRL